MRAARHAARATCGLLLLAAVAAGAAQLEAQLKTCAGLRDDARRLACFDRTVAPLLASGGDSAEAKFGMAESADREAISSISAQIKSLEEAAGGSLLIELDNGQLWRQVDSRELLLKVGDRVTISRGAMNSFRIATADNRYGRVRRLR